MINRKLFREFCYDQEAGEWIRSIQLNKDKDDKNSIANLLYFYEGNKRIEYNCFLRG
ncbi:hypothetical protein [Clostridium estertheticum]|uniref:Uncharacterized protein n=1 Tax=Clostridium estertheticum TaxID=238834 RepID=A0AA47EEU5_9CLOT|nr:hypothetical protein [Clostridium estertheticum]MBU3155014.1 hypothetical protein [Clostridium estertheticum]WAG58832.1 hypothetical protein LL038_14340 [Clostridium estertheticum]